MFNDGISVITIIIVVIPPTQCVILRQKSMDIGNCSMFGTMVVPVVVNPEIVSKKISKPDGIALPIKYGRVPVKTIMNHETVIKKTLSLLLVIALNFLFETKYSKKPVAIEISAGIKKGKSGSL